MLLRVRCKCIPPAIVASAFKSRAATTLANRYVRSVCIQPALVTQIHHT